MTNKEAIKVLNMIEAHGSLAIQAKEKAIQALEAQENKGKWITEKFVTICICSKCGYGSIIGAPKYCPDCGAEMEVDD